jgi:formylglycine-generating enzyme required for sulfatase activity
MPWRSLAITIAGLLWLLGSLNPLAAQEDNRFALIIANQDYADKVGRLHNPRKDATLIRAALIAVGFPADNIEVIQDASRGQMLAGVRRHARRLSASGDALGFFYYSGHGAAKPNTDRNYLIPVTVRDALADELWDDAVALDEVKDILQDHAPRAANIVVFDACRNELQSGQRGVKGFVPVLDWGGMLIAYSTAPGQTASDGERNAPAGPYATVLAAELRAARGISASDLFARVRARMRSGAENQSPWFLYGLDRQVLFGESVPSGPGESQPPLSEAARAWESIKVSDDIPTLEAFRAQFGASNPYYDWQAQQRIAVLKKQQVCNGVEVKLGGGTRCVKPGSRESFKDCPDCPEMVVVPAGKFMMGLTQSEIDALTKQYGDYFKDEGPQHSVTIPRPFAVGKFEVTFAEWEACVSDGGCKHKPQDQGWGRKDRPVINVSWDDITGEYLPWLRKKTGHDYRLLTEAEWEYAARAGTAGPFSFEGGITTDKANYDGDYTYAGSPKGEYRQKTVPVKSFAANPWGLYQVHGNVWEWVQDCKIDYQDTPSDGSSAKETSGCARVLRGGSWGSSPKSLRSASRLGFYPDDRIFSNGFRVARTLLPL